jgi:hypothetical protein
VIKPVPLFIRFREDQINNVEFNCLIPPGDKYQSNNRPGVLASNLANANLQSMHTRINSALSSLYELMSRHNGDFYLSSWTNIYVSSPWVFHPYKPPLHALCYSNVHRVCSFGKEKNDYHGIDHYSKNTSYHINRYPQHTDIIGCITISS